MAKIKKIKWISIGKEIETFLYKKLPIERELEFLEKIIEKSKAPKSKVEKLLREKKKSIVFEEGSVKKEKQEAKELLKWEKAKQDLEKIQEDEINWLEGEYYKNWDRCKAYAKFLWRHKKEYLGESPKWFFPAHFKDIIQGKPQLIDSVQRQIPLVRLAVNKIKCSKEENLKGIKEIQSYFFIDEKFDKRYDGFQQDSFRKYFWMYQVITPDEKKYFILSKEKLPNENCVFHGMILEIGDFAEMSRSLKLPTISSFFFVKDFKPSVKILSKKEVIELTKKNEINEMDWLSTLSYHPLGSVNNFPMESELLKSAYILSGKVDGWPMHLGVVGPPGTTKTCGYVETLGYKFAEVPKIAEGSSWTLKGLIPSYKGTIPDVGYLIRAERVALIDEIGKMIEREMNKHDGQAFNLLGDFNFILEHKKRDGGSGNTGEISMEATAKNLFVTNPVSRRETISLHVGLLDPTFMSRIFWWVQDEEEQKFVLSGNGILRDSCTSVGGNEDIPPQTRLRVYQDFKNSIINFNFLKCENILLEDRRRRIRLKKSWGEMNDRNVFLTIFDTCYSFVCEIADNEVKRLADEVTLLAKEPMKSSVWKPRAYHHVKLLVDGLCKYRCLFRDYDSTFTAKKVKIYKY